MKTEIAMGDCIKRYLEREKWRERATDRRNWRLLIKNVLRKSERNKNDETEIMVNSPHTTGKPRKQQHNAV